MERYERPEAEVLLFLPRQGIAAQTLTEPTLGEDMELTSPPEIDEGIGDW